MPLSTLSGTRLRERRLGLGLRQSVVAAAAGISASYLNLIEHNRRKVTSDLAVRLADALGMDRAALSGGGDAGLVDGLHLAAGRAAGRAAGQTAGQTVEVDRLDEFVGRFPGWAALVVGLDSRVQGLERALAALNDRMTHDPHLSQALHELLSSLSSVRAAAAILAETPDLPTDWTARFHRNLNDDSARLVTGAEALVAYLDAGSPMTEHGILAPQEEVEDWLSRRGWVLDDDALAGGLRDELAALASSAARSLAQAHVAQAAQDARALPQPELAEVVALLGPDALAIAERLALDPLLVMRRLAGLPQAEAGLVICDASGSLTFRKPATGFPLPRFGAACPLWPLFVALGRPMQPVEAVVTIAGQAGRRFRVVAWGQIVHPAGLRGPELRTAAMLIHPAEAARTDALVVGSTCRVCPRSGCPARREPSILSEAV